MEYRDLTAREREEEEKKKRREVLKNERRQRSRRRTDDWSDRGSGGVVTRRAYFLWLSPELAAQLAEAGPRRPGQLPLAVPLLLDPQVV